MSPETAQFIEIFVGAAFVVFFGLDLFNKPVASPTDAGTALQAARLAGSSRNSTTTLSYYGALGTYLTVLLLVWGLLTMNRRWIRGLLAALPDNGGENLGYEYLSAPLLAALLVTVLLPRIPYLSRIETWTRKWLQSAALIPEELFRQARPEGV